MRPDLADRIRGNYSLDPFHNDANIVALCDWVAEETSGYTFG
jgi:hypothetical protein